MGSSAGLASMLACVAVSAAELKPTTIKFMNTLDIAEPVDCVARSAARPSPTASRRVAALTGSVAE